MGIAYERKEGAHSRTFAFLKSYLWVPESGCTSLAFSALPRRSTELTCSR